MQNTVASMAGAVASLTVSAPMDVIKTRIQNKNFENPETGLQILRTMIREEGFTAFFKGLTPKILTVGPKLVFSYVPSIVPFILRFLALRFLGGVADWGVGSRLRSR
jgi:hypothetical protein